MGCRRMLGVQDRAEIMAGLGAGLSQERIARLIGRCPSVVCREIVRHEGPDEAYRAEEAGNAARAGRHRPKERVLDRKRCRCMSVVRGLFGLPVRGKLSSALLHASPRGEY